jgi:hypothetical protein
MRYAIVFLAGMATPFIVPYLFAVLHDRVYMPLFWTPRHRRRCAKVPGGDLVSR